MLCVFSISDFSSFFPTFLRRYLQTIFPPILLNHEYNPPWWHRNTFLAVFKAFNIHGSDFYYFLSVAEADCMHVWALWTISKAMWLNDLWWLTLYIASILLFLLGFTEWKVFCFLFNFSHRSISIIVLVRLHWRICAHFIYRIIRWH